MFSPIDAEMNRFIKAMQAITFGEGAYDFLFSGYDIEKWMMKCCLSMKYAEILKADFDFRFFSASTFMDCLINPGIGNKSGGLYMDARIGQDLAAA